MPGQSKALVKRDPCEQSETPAAAQHASPVRYFPTLQTVNSVNSYTDTTPMYQDQQQESEVEPKVITWLSLISSVQVSHGS